MLVEENLEDEKRNLDRNLMGNDLFSYIFVHALTAKPFRSLEDHLLDFFLKAIYPYGSSKLDIQKHEVMLLEKL